MSGKVKVLQLKTSALDDRYVKKSGDTVTGNLELDADLNHDGSNAGFFGKTPTTQQAFTAVSDPPTQAQVTAIRDALINLGLMASS